MFLTITKSDCELLHPIDNHLANKTIAVREFIYEINFFNISEKLGNNYIIVKGIKHVISDGYYNFCSLSDALFKPHNIKTELDYSNLRLSIESKDIFELPTIILEQLGLTKMDKRSVNGKTTIVGSKEVNLKAHQNISICLRQLSNSDNLFNGQPSKVLRSLPITKDRYGDTVSHVFTPQFKKLECSYLNQFSITFIDNNNKTIEIENFTLVLEII